MEYSVEQINAIFNNLNAIKVEGIHNLKLLTGVICILENPIKNEETTKKEVD